MSSSPSAEELITLVRSYYDSTNSFHFTQETSPETNRRHALWAQWISNREPWLAFSAAMASKLPDYIIGETYSSHDGGPRCIVYPPDHSRTSLPDWTVVGCLSLLAPVCFVYGVERDLRIEDGVRRNKSSFEPPPPHMSSPARIITSTMETFFEVSTISREVAKTPVRLFVGDREPPETALFHALFTDEPETIP